RGTDPNVLVHYLACGLGGAFLHPTHWLTDTKVEVEWQAAQPLKQTPIGTAPDGTPRYSREFQLERDGGTGRESVNAVFPDKTASARLTWRNLGFGAINPQFALFVAAVAIFSAWLLHFGARALGTALVDLRALPTGAAVRAFLELLFATPWPTLVIAG